MRPIRVKSWRELPRILKPGVYIVNGEKFVVKEPVEKEVMKSFMDTVKKIDREYY